MVKNLPLLIAMFLIGNSIFILSMTIKIPELLHWTFVIVALLLNISSVIGLILHVGTRRTSKN